MFFMGSEHSLSYSESIEFRAMKGVALRIKAPLTAEGTALEENHRS
jgi:hypothetical protein